MPVISIPYCRYLDVKTAVVRGTGMLHAYLTWLGGAGLVGLMIQGGMFLFVLFLDDLHNQYCNWMVFLSSKKKGKGCLIER